MAYTGYWEKRFTKIYKALYGNAMLVSRSGTYATGYQQKHLFSSFPSNAETVYIDSFFTVSVLNRGQLLTG